MTTLMQDLIANPLFAGGMALGITGTLAALGRKLPGKLWQAIERQCTVTVDIASGDPLFDALKVWFDRHHQVGQSRRVSASIDADQFKQMMVCPPGARVSAAEPAARILFTPAPGDHFLVYRGVVMWVTRERKESTNSNSYDWYRETFTIRALTRDRELVRAMLVEAQSAARSDRGDAVGVFVQQWGPEWTCVLRRKARPLDSVLLDGDDGDRLYRKLRRFLDDEAWYVAMGVPYHAGCLFEGIPGSGKSSLAVALAGALGLDIYMLSLAAKGLDDDMLRRLVANTPPRAMLLIEDIDGVFANREATSDAVKVTFAGLLNVLDGVASHHGSIVIMSTNHVERLDPALIRRGRIDHRLTFRHATRNQARRLFERFFPGAASALAERFAAAVPAGTCCMADLQGFLLERRDDAARAVEDAVAGELRSR